MRTFLGFVAIRSLSLALLIVWNSVVFGDLRRYGRNLEEGVTRQVLMELAEEALYARLKKHQKIVFSTYSIKTNLNVFL